ncbi:polyvinyl alcohol dehydrogenase (cytochrome) [Actinoplanes octamycinicus]|uniref:Polyvinyl alcohol dehydrogenase (Cytochrome) n=1 Tax=Actinoplanes octamycinicus TaxID=135948 RepID=A0A7W7H8F0_9ACTN|nr:PQQ-binding-like beta-propeller repeat protein [Actinoplanes octamycinicus]MBB4745799.1 polyvinyl alcohol dehydrogenase (cytochrome) [Actinoplanes octamycinicus]GIE63601.1 polyvinylalcohol dehydrogenase [Actinoplanes octamycinicus]
MLRSKSRLAGALVAAMLAITASTSPAAANPLTDWTSNGKDLLNTRANLLETKITSKNVSRLKPKWTFTTHGDVSATPIVSKGAVYFPDWGGYLHKLDAATGAEIWSHQISDYDGVAGSISRTAVAISGNTLFLGTQTGARLLAVDATTGALKWSTQLDPHIAAILTMSPIVHNGVVYEGVSSTEGEMSAFNPDYKCCTFRGNFNAVDAATGKVLWKRYMVPDNNGQPTGYAGGAMWGTPAIDPLRKTIFVTSGQNYRVPDSVNACQDAGGTPPQCYSPDNHIDSILALDLKTGDIKWATGAMRFDAWNASCIPGLPPNNCPANEGYDYDFGDGAHLFAYKDSSGKIREAVGGGEKSGEYWALNPENGEVLWSAAPGPGGHVGGIMWGTAWDTKRIYVAEADWNKTPYQMADGTTISGSSYAALDPATGRIVWQVADPTPGFAWGPLTVAADVVYGSSTSGHMYAMESATGRILWDFTAPYSSNAGAAVVDGTVYWGNGYQKFALGAGTTGSFTTGTFYAFSVDGK